MIQSDSSSSSDEENNQSLKSKSKQQRRIKKHQQQIKVLLTYKLQYPYYDENLDQLHKNQYYKSIKNSKAKQGYIQLNQLISSTFKHARRRINLFPIIQRHPDYTLRCIFTGKILQTADGVRLEKCDQQHSFPQSYQKGKKSGTGRDMHAIFAASKNANGSRGNKPFGKISQNILRDDERGIVYKGQKFNTYVPKINIGAVCRSTLYILTCYKGCANKEKFPKYLLPWIVQNAYKQPVTLWQKHRNAQLYRLQKNRNPFIDHPEWCTQINFELGWQQ